MKGNLYYNGNGCNVDFLKAFELYKKAAKKGDDCAQNNLGINN